MPSWLPSVPYTVPRTGYWSPVTSTLNWCEEDYYFTRFSAEIVNTLTNLLFVYLAVKGISNCLRNNHDVIFLITFVGYLVVGIGSFLFHCTLTYAMQLVDELAMIYTTCLMFYATFSYNRSQAYRLWLGAFLVSLCIFITGYYHYLQDPRFHQNMYALLTIIVLGRSFYVMEMNLRPYWRNARYAPVPKHIQAAAAISPEARQRAEELDLAILNRMYTMTIVGISSFLGGFFLWNVDNVYCSTLRRWRREVGLPWGLLFEGHGWWHLLTGTGAYIYIVWGIMLRHCLNGRQKEIDLVWPSVWTSFPVVELRPPTEDRSVKPSKDAPGWI